MSASIALCRIFVMKMKKERATGHNPRNAPRSPLIFGCRKMPAQLVLRFGGRLVLPARRIGFLVPLFSVLLCSSALSHL